MKLAEYLKQSRIKSGKSQADVATYLGYSTPQFISNWERGISHPPINAIRALAQYYNLSEEELFRVIEEATIEEVANSLRNKFQSSKQKRSIG